MRQTYLIELALTRGRCYGIYIHVVIAMVYIHVAISMVYIHVAIAMVYIHVVVAMVYIHVVGITNNAGHSQVHICLDRII